MVVSVLYACVANIAGFVHWLVSFDQSRVYAALGARYVPSRNAAAAQFLQCSAKLSRSTVCERKYIQGHLAWLRQMRPDLVHRAVVET